MRVMLGLFCFCWVVPALAQQAGKVDFVDGKVAIVDAANKERQPRLGDIVNAGETIRTGSDGELHLAMMDGGELGIHANTAMRIEKYKAEGGKDDTSVFNLLQGAMRSVTGWIGKYNARNYAIRTPTATIGVRGTDHETRVIPEGSREGEPGTYDKVNAGATEMRTRAGTTQIRPNQAGFFGFGNHAKPTVLARVPEFFKPMKSERRFDGLHERVRERLPALREERVKHAAVERAERKRALESENRQRVEQRRSVRDQGREQKLQQQRQLREDRRSSYRGGQSAAESGRFGNRPGQGFEDRRGGGRQSSLNPRQESRLAGDKAGTHGRGAAKAEYGAARDARGGAGAHGQNFSRKSDGRGR